MGGKLSLSYLVCRDVSTLSCKTHCEIVQAHGYGFVSPPTTQNAKGDEIFPTRLAISCSQYIRCPMVMDCEDTTETECRKFYRFVLSSTFSFTGSLLIIFVSRKYTRQTFSPDAHRRPYQPGQPYCIRPKALCDTGPGLFFH